LSTVLFSLKTWLKSNERYVFPFLSLVIPLVVRAVPEILMGPYVVGFDTIGYYVPTTFIWLNGGVNFWHFMAAAPFLYVLLMGVTSMGIPIIVSLKVMSPLLLGFLGLIVYFYANKTLAWSTKKSLLVVLFATLYFVALRVSWDMLRSELGLIFLFTTLILLKKEGSPFKNVALLSLAMLSVVFAHQLVTIIMFAIIIATIMRSYLDRKMVEVRKLIFCSAPAAFLFFVIIYARIILQHPITSGFSTEVSGEFMPIFGFASYTDLVVNTLGFLAFCFLPLLPLVLLGARRFKSNLQLKAWIFWIFLALLLILVTNAVFFDVYPYRWILLLTYPLAFCAAEAVSSLKHNSYKAIVSLISLGLILTTLSVSFMVLPNGVAFTYFDAFPTYVPKSMLQNTVPLLDCQDTANALQWAQNNMPSTAQLLTHDAFYGWASLTFNSSQLIRYGFGNPEQVARQIMEKESTHQLYLIWWVNGSGWYGQSCMSSDFKQVYQSGRIAIFAFT
jgi:hypothetical protein